MQLETTGERGKPVDVIDVLHDTCLGQDGRNRSQQEMWATPRPGFGRGIDGRLSVALPKGGVCEDVQ